MTPEQSQQYDNALAEGKCPLCGEKLINEGGCQHCIKCGWSACNND